MTSLVFLLSSALGIAGAEPKAMNDIGGTLDLPPGWEQVEWSDWDFKAHTRDKAVAAKVWMTPFQVEPSQAAAKAWAASCADDLRNEGAGDVRSTEVTVKEVGGRKVAWIRERFRFDGGKGPAGVLYSAAFPGAGHVVHLRTVAALRNDRRARAGLTELLGHFTLDKKPLPTTRDVSSEAGFAATLPEGWRAPVNGELSAVSNIAQKVGEAKLSPHRCWVGVRPPAVGDPDVILACKMARYLPPVDRYSFEGVEAQVHQMFFDRVKIPVPAADQVEVGDRLGFYYKPPVTSTPTRLVITPFRGGLMLIWGLGEALDADGLDAAITQLLPTVRFTGPDGGKPIISADQWVLYYLRYRPTSPVVIVPALGLLALVIGGLTLAKRKRKPRYEEI